MIKKFISNRIYVVRSACMKTNRRFEQSRIGSSLIAIHRSSDSPALRACIVNPDSYMDKGRIVKDSRTTKVALTELDDGTKVFIKRYNNKGLKYTFKNMWRQARVFRAWRSAWSLEACGIPTPKNYAAVSFRRCGVLKSAFLITEMLEDTVDILEFYKIIQKDEALRMQYVDDIVRMIAILHENGIVHGDLKLSNTFVQKSDGELYCFGLWDLDGTKFYREGISDEKRRLELARIIASYIELGLRIGVDIDQDEAENMFLNIYSRHTMVGLKGKAISDLIKLYVVKSHKRIKSKK